MIPKPLSYAIVTVVTLVWVGNFAASVFLPDYRSDPMLNFIFSVIVGSALALRQDGTGNLMLRMITAWRGMPQLPAEPKPKDEEDGEA